jgi:WD40-like Beta Propeller Repeat
MLLRWTALGMLVLMSIVVSGCNSTSTSVQPNPTPSITALYPASITAGSQSFTLFIAGNGFIAGSSGTSTAYWNGSPRASTVNLNTNEIAITVLASDVASPGSAAVTVSNPIPGGGVSQNAATFQIYPVQPNAPQISNFSPMTAAPKGAAFTITVNGANFVSGNSNNPNMPNPTPPYTGSIVAWNGSPRATTFVSATQLTAQIVNTDIQTAGCDNISVFTYGGGGNVVYSPALSFTVASSGTPVICSISPASVVAGASAFTLSVVGAGYSSGSTVDWNGSSRTTTFVNANSLQAQITSTDVAKAGTAAVTVTGGGGGASAPVDFVISPTPPATPTITSVSPSDATAGGAAFTLTVTGTNFIPQSVVDWNGGARATTYKNATTLSAAIQASDIATAGTAQISVASFGANGGVATSAPFPYTINPSSMAAQFPQVVSISAVGGPADGPSEAPAISADGRYVAFYSQAKNLVTPQAAGNIFVRDTCVGAASNCTPKTLAVDVAPDGSAPNGKTGRQVAISADGRFVGFISRSTNLVSGGAAVAPGYWELYVRDLCTGINAPSGCVPNTKMSSVGDDGAAANAPSASPSISGDGRYVAFVSAATNLGAGAIATGPQVYIRDTCEGPTGTKSCIPSTLAVPVDEADQTAGAQAGRPAISADGRYVAYEMWATQSAGQSAVSTSQIVLADTCLGVEVPVVCSASAQRISYASDGAALGGANISPSINSDGRFVAFESQPSESASAASTSASTSRAFLRDTCVGPTAPDGCTPSVIQIATDSGASAAKSQSFSPAVSASGRYVSFVSGIVSSAPAGEATEGSLLVRDTCFAAALPCTPHTYIVPASAAAFAAAHVTLASFSTANSSKVAPLIVDKYSTAPISSDGRFAAFYAPDTVAAQPASGIGDVYLTITPFQ